VGSLRFELKTSSVSRNDLVLLQNDVGTDSLRVRIESEKDFGNHQTEKEKDP
jgi:hypothetical protein